ncbi:uncharacterized protein ColSpa_01868 [Colletotrichum spaethianum]|uniref:BRCT domain-containing protein n=1 Tax=Colletotrichum spaethianum TaxID=700344 RepID=A0AA37L4F9_9PEZI|nr:uncharacterized protein ColSpa_01868 [Colletotrichum spaethianum]GKT41687.1 hypothetical protein ColSpa_01868 [Colletotrichum spaethianum]
MEPQSPPKRITRSRAAKTGDTTTSTRTTKIVTAAAKAKANPTAPTRSTSAKRKTRADDVEDEEHDEQSQQPETAARTTRATRGRPRKTTEDTAEPVASSSSGVPGRATRARAAARKVSTTEPAAPKEEPVKPTRGRPRKTATEDVPAKEAEPVKKTTTTTRTRAAAVTTAKPAVKKTVTFQEPEKENIAPDASKKTTDNSTTATGLRARPVRKPPVPKAPRSTKAAATTTSTSKPEKTPLSPKKVTQVPLPRDCSEDELAGPDTPPRPMMKSPTKPPASALGSSKKLNLLPFDKAAETEHAEDDENSAKSEAQEDEVTNSLASPAKRLPASPHRDTMKSPAKRAEGVSLLKPTSSMNPSAEGGSNSPSKASLLQSPAKRPQSLMKPFTLPSAHEGEKISNFKASLLQSPAKRPLSPIKGMKPLEASGQLQSPATKPLLLSTPTALRPVKRSSEKLMAEELNGHDEEGDDELDEVAEAMLNESIHLEEPMQFPGRLSAVLPRHADPVLKKDMPVFEAAKEQAKQVEQANYSQQTEATSESDVFTDAAIVDAPDFNGEPMMVDEESYFQSQPQDTTQAAPQLTLNAPSGLFGLRQKDMDPFNNVDSDSDDELANSPRVSAAHTLVPATPTPANSRQSPAKSRVSSIGFTPLAQQLNAWSAASPAKTPRRPVTPGRPAATPRAEDSPLRSTYFEDEMTVRADMDAQNEIEDAIDAEISAAADAEDPEFDDLMVTDEDMALAAEANEMSLMEPGQLDEIVNTSNSFDDTLSEASQEYGDENEMPVDPAMFNGDVFVPPTTPNRVVAREFHTVSKVPLKPADESTPRPKKKRAASISRLPVSRPSLNRSATVISYSPSRKHKAEAEQEQENEEENDENESEFAPVTPAKSDVWSSLGTPARTPRRDLNPGLLRGAVVFVDVHTTEGADASNSDAAKIGITHVVYKDGGKRTMEKVRESNGVVQCVGVSWVLDCERENEWLDEAPYYIDTSLVPRGGARRRKSMEPKSLANQNGMLVPTPVKAGRDAKTAPNTPMNRRDSTVWMHTPSDEAEDDDDDWQGLISPVPATPAPEALARYAAETPSASTEYDSSPTKALLMQTCPPKPNNYAQMGDGILNRDKDESVMQRLMAARRKSLQFAPKIGSPLAKAWK